MKKTIQLILTTAFIAAIGMPNGKAQLPVSQPTGIITKQIIGNGGFTPIGIPFTRTPVARAVVSSTSGSTINVVGTPFGIYNNTTLPHSVLFATGVNSGVTLEIVSSTSSSITLNGTVPSGVVNNSDEVIVIPDWTLGTLFGTTANPSGLTSGSNQATVDIVYAGSGALTQYYHNGTNWRSLAAATNRNDLRIGGLNGGVMVLKRSAGNIPFNITGTLRSGKQVVTIPNGFSIRTFTEVSNTTLLNSQLISSGALVGNSSQALTDIVYVPNAGGALVQYYWNNVNPLAGNWRSLTSAGNTNTLPIRADTALVINKRSPGDSTLNIQEVFVP